MKKIVATILLLLSSVQAKALTANYVTKASSTSFITNSQIQDNGTGVGIGTSPAAGVMLKVLGSVDLTAGISASTGVFSGNVSVGSLSASTAAFTGDISVSGLSATYGVSAATGVFSGALTAATLNTGHGANELYDMDQNVLTTSSPTFAGLILNGNALIRGPTPWVDVKAYGAVGNGVTDDTIAFQSALATGSNVFISSGIFPITISSTGTENAALKTKTGQEIFGMGDLSIVKQNGAHLGQGNGYLFCNEDTTNGNTDIKLHDFTIEMSSIPVTVGVGMDSWSIAVQFNGVKRVEIYNMKMVNGSIDIRTGDGIINTPTALTGDARAEDIWVHNNHFLTPPGQCPTLFQVNRAKIEHNVILGNYDSGISILSAGYDIIVAGNTIDKQDSINTAGTQIEVTMDSAVAADNPNTTPGRNVSMSDIKIIGNTVIGSTNVYSGFTNHGISFAGLIENGTISGNHIYTAKSNGIGITNYKRNVKVDGNIVKGCGQVGILWSDDGSTAHSHNSISYNLVSNNASTATTPSGITVGDAGSVAMDDFKIIGNQTWDDQVSKTQVRGIRINVANGITDSILANNICEGTTAPIQLAGLYSSLNQSNNVTGTSYGNTALVWEGDSTNGVNGFQFYNSGSNAFTGDGAIVRVSAVNSSDTGTAMKINHSGSSGTALRIDAVGPYLFTTSSGSVGFGTTAPAGAFHVKGSSPTFYLQEATDGTPRKLLSLDSLSNLYFYANLNQSISFMDRDYTTERMHINTGSGVIRMDAYGAGVATFDSSGYISSTAGITNSTSYWLCTAADCSTKCQATIVNGIITRCP